MVLTQKAFVYVWYPVRGTHKVCGGLDEISIMQSVLAGWFSVLWQISHGILILWATRHDHYYKYSFFFNVFGYRKMKKPTFLLEEHSCRFGLEGQILFKWKIQTFCVLYWNFSADLKLQIICAPLRTYYIPDLNNSIGQTWGTLQ